MEQGSDAPSNEAEQFARNFAEGDERYLETEYYEMMYGNWEDWREAYEEMAGYGRGQ